MCDLYDGASMRGRDYYFTQREWDRAVGYGTVPVARWAWCHKILGGEINFDQEKTSCDCPECLEGHCRCTDTGKCGECLCDKCG